MKRIRYTIFLLLVAFVFVFSYESCRSSKSCILVKGISFDAITSNSIILPPNEIIKFNEVFFRFSITTDRFVCKNSSPSLVTEAKAFKSSMLEVYYDTLQSIKITSNNRYDANHPAGASLNDLFDIPTKFPEDYSVYSYSSTQFRLLQAPDSARVHEFNILASFNNNTQYAAVLNPITILP